MTLRQVQVALVSAGILLSTTIVIADQLGAFRSGPPPEWESCEDMQEFYIRRFESALGFGLSRMPTPPMLDRSGVLDLGRARYTIQRLELVGLLNGPDPVVYEPIRHNVKVVEDYRSRALTPFETRALAKLRAGGFMEYAEGPEPGTLLAFGALRGDGSCLKCHKDKKEGDLLGAFTYALRVKPQS
jgi:hypothetical protein